MLERVGPPRVALVAAFAAIYLVWGSTYLAIRVAVREIPPLWMTGVRCSLAGLALWTLAALTGSAERRLAVRSGELAPFAAWRDAAISGALLFAGGQGLLASAERRIDSGVASVVLATIPMWMALLGWLLHGTRPSARTLLGLALGFGGVASLTLSSGGPGATGHDRAGVLLLLASALSWACGSIFACSRPTVDGLQRSVARQLVCGGALLLILGALAGEPRIVWAAHIGFRSLLALAWLVCMGSIVAFTAYAWLLRVATPAAVSSYAFVNPVVALTLGVALGGETLGPRTIAAASAVVCGVALLVLRAGASSRVEASKGESIWSERYATPGTVSRRRASTCARS